MQAFASCRFTEGHKTERFQTSLHLLRSLDNTGKVDLRCGIEVKDQAAGHLRLMGLAIPGVKFDRAQLRDRCQAFDRSICR